MNTIIHPTPDALVAPNGPPADPASRTPSLDALALSLGKVRTQAGDAAHELSEGAVHVAHGSLEVLRQRVAHVGDLGAGYVRQHPLQSVLIAAGTGAALALLMRALWRSQ